MSDGVLTGSPGDLELMLVIGRACESVNRVLKYTHPGYVAKVEFVRVE